MSHECNKCGRTFDTQRGLSLHQTQTHDNDRPWTDADRLRRMYHEKRMNQGEIADELGTIPSVISEWMERHGIEARDHSESKINEMGEKPWHDEERLRRMYHDKEMSLRQMASDLGCDSSIVRRWMDRFNIERRSRVEAVRSPVARYYTDTGGYEQWSTTENCDTVHVAVHQLLAIAKGASPQDVFSGEHHVHHDNEIPWDNRPENIEVLTVSEHRSIHAKRRLSDPEDEFGEYWT